ncbi:hypothetical protein ACJQWK_09825 [Exserohilum turcicum]
MPWLREHRLKAEIQKSQWETRVIMEGKELEGCYFPKLEFGNVRIRILMDSVARLEAIRLSGAEKLKKVFRRLKTEKRWWIVDFFEHDSSGNERAALNWEQEAVRSFFYPPTREWSAIHPSEKALLRRTIHDDARRISTTQGIGDAFRELSQLPSLWSKGTFTYLSDVRKSFCYELKTTSGLLSTNGGISHWDGILRYCSV